MLRHCSVLPMSARRSCSNWPCSSGKQVHRTRGSHQSASATVQQSRYVRCGRIQPCWAPYLTRRLDVVDPADVARKRRHRQRRADRRRCRVLRLGFGRQHLLRLQHHRAQTQRASSAQRTLHGNHHRLLRHQRRAQHALPARHRHAAQRHQRGKSRTHRLTHQEIQRPSAHHRQRRQVRTRRLDQNRLLFRAPPNRQDIPGEVPSRAKGGALRCCIWMALHLQSRPAQPQSRSLPARLGKVG